MFEKYEIFLFTPNAFLWEKKAIFLFYRSFKRKWRILIIDLNLKFWMLIFFIYIGLKLTTSWQYIYQKFETNSISFRETKREI